MARTKLAASIALILAAGAFGLERRGVVANRCDYDPIYFDFSVLPDYCRTDNSGCSQWRTDSANVWVYRVSFSPWSGNTIRDVGVFNGDLFASEFKDVYPQGYTADSPVLVNHLYVVGTPKKGYALIHVLNDLGGCVNWKFHWRYNDSASFFPGDPVSIRDRATGRPAADPKRAERDALGRDPGVNPGLRAVFPHTESPR